jgi:hypothetical protein
MILVSQGCIFDVVLSGKKNNSIFFKPSIVFGWAGQL